MKNSLELGWLSASFPRSADFDVAAVADVRLDHVAVDGLAVIRQLGVLSEHFVAVLAPESK